MSKTPLNRGDYWFSLLTDKTTPVHGLCASVKAADGQINGYPTRFIAVVPDANNHYPRATQGEVGLLEGWTLAKVVNQVISEDANKPQKRAIVAVIDVPSQAYGRREEAFGIHQALAGAAGAYAEARLAGHPIIGLIVGKAMSGAFLAHGYQANSLIAFNNAGVMIHAMGKESAARITLRSVESLENLASSIPPMAYDIANYSTLGLLDRLMNIDDPDNAKPFDVTQVREAIAESIEKNQQQGNDLSHRLGAANRQSSSQVRERMRAEW